MGVDSRAALLQALPFLALLAFPLIEVGAFAVSQAGVASEADWRAAADFVRAQTRSGAHAGAAGAPAGVDGRDLIVAAPGWADPLLREVLGDRIDLAMAGRSDTARYETLWSVSVRGARPPEAPPGPPDLARQFGAVRVERYRLGKSPLVHDLVESVLSARVELWKGGEARTCKLSDHRPGRRGGLGFGVLPPARRFQCPDRRGFVWVAPVVMEDLSLTPRRCVFQHPAGREPVTVRFDDVPLGERLVVHAGLYYEHERMQQGAPVELAVHVASEQGGERTTTMKHEDGQGWRRMVIDTREHGGGRGQIRFDVTSDDPKTRIFCWAASTRAGPERSP